ncbi:MAG: hypothetical protein CSA62_02385 [Planctomycetota bacterium]|nr:MAG: hypothetical protein CSA62_02385 [Planctomycetota bacterium]
MTGSEALPVARGEQQELQHEFQLFRQAASALEAAYQELKQRASQVDQDLAVANRALHTALADRESIIGQLPIGVFRLEGTELLAQNPEGHTIAGRIAGDKLRSWLSSLPTGAWSESRIPADGGEPRELRALCVPLEARGESLWFVEDTTMLSALREQVERLHRLSSLSELSLGIAHEVLNPLNGVAGFASLLRKRPDSEKAAHWAQNIETGVVRIHSIIRDLLDFARPERRSTPCVRSLATWLEEARPELNDIELNLGDPEVAVQGSPEALGKVFANLVRNARQAGASKLEVECESADGRLRIRLQDDGPGIPSDLASRIFDPFYSTRDEGTGLGLAFCARALEAMGGTIRWLPSERGARFELVLPEAR